MKPSTFINQFWSRGYINPFAYEIHVNVWRTGKLGRLNEDELFPVISDNHGVDINETRALRMSEKETRECNTNNA